MIPSIKLGTRVRDIITGFSGTLVSRIEYINGCVHYGVAGVVDKDGKVPNSEYFDWQRIEVLDVGFADKFDAFQQAEHRGGPNRDAPR